MKEQTYPVQEIICIDDCSTDHTTTVIEEFISDNPYLPIKLLKNNSNQGPSFSRNRGWDVAQGDYLAFLDADDAWHRQKIAIQYSWMLTNPQISVCGHAYLLISSEDSEDYFKIKPNFKTYIFSQDEIIFSNPFVTPSVMLKRNLNYRFNPNQRYCEDYLLWLQICLDAHQISMLDVELTYIYKSFGKSGLTRNLWQMKWGDTKNYWQLWKSNRISFGKAIFLIMYSLIKVIPLIIFGPEYYAGLKQRMIMNKFES
ncbi:glycosyltransferase family 2 protein [Laspinema olomoucense]|uniref:Glycosyltransferase family 2 protein n=1 Tax=Laspinema olomoucense D3b TaxID=2953688 RepID=A0ABT2N407_9CYAN|nr:MULTISPECIES: glycosyltransferase family A protein [unclassified Laspinema]MCT7977397.1 glycosyltransferase family 2 protein [Laspinema sp. D3b]MCT7986816.1 glycosyltransferase family 2 protein [Laspinema sp. D3a]